MTRLAYNKNRPPAAGRSLQSLSPKTIAAIALMAVMGLLWLRVLTNGKTGPAAAQASQTTERTAAQAAAPLKITPVTLPVIAGRHDTLKSDFFSLDNWGEFNQTTAARQTSSDLSDQERLALRHKTFIEGLFKTLNLDAILHGTDGAPARACIDGNVLTQGQTLTVKNNTETYDVTVSEIGESQVVLTWNEWNAVLNMTQPERVD